MLETTHRKTVRLIVVVPVDRRVSAVQVAVPRVRRIILRRRPPVAVGGAIVETAAVVVAG